MVHIITECSLQAWKFNKIAARDRSINKISQQLVTRTSSTLIPWSLRVQQWTEWKAAWVPCLTLQISHPQWLLTTPQRTQDTPLWGYRLNITSQSPSSHQSTEFSPSAIPWTQSLPLVIESSTANVEAAYSFHLSQMKTQLIWPWTRSKSHAD